MRCILLVLGLSFFPGPAVGTSFSVPLPDLVGVFDFLPHQGPPRHASFDFGQQFSEIENVWLEIEAHVLPETFLHCGTVSNPQPCERRSTLLGLIAFMDMEGTHPRSSEINTFGVFFGDPTDPEGSGIGSASFDNRQLQTDYSFLFDGQGTLKVFWNSQFFFDDLVFDFTDPSGEIFNARLIVEGTPIPEPTTFMMFAAGLLVLTGTRRWLRE